MDRRNTELAELVIENWEDLKNRGPVVRSFINRLKNTKNQGIALFGGAVRDWYLRREPRDLDVVVHTSDFQSLIKDLPKTENQFGGDVVTINGITFDIWNLPETSFIKEGKFPLDWQTLVDMVPFNISGIVVMADGWTSTNPSESKRTTVYENGFWNAMDSKVIDFVNRDHPEPKRVAVRAMVMAERYKFGLSFEVNRFVEEQLTAREIRDIRAGKWPPKKKGASITPQPAPVIDPLKEAFDIPF